MIIDAYVVSVENAIPETEDFASVLQQVSDDLDSQSENIATYNGLLQKMQKGTMLTAEEVYKLVDSNGELAPMLEEVDGMYKINIESLTDLRDTAIQTTKDKMKADLKDIESVRNKTIANLQNYGLEIEALKTLAEARAATQKKIDGMMSGGGSTVDKYNKLQSSGLLGQPLDDELKAYYEIEGKYQEVQAKIKALENTTFGTDIKTDKKSLDKKISEQFDKAISTIQEKRNKLDQEIAKVDAQIEVATITGDTKTVDELSNKMGNLLQQRKQLTAQENVEYANLKKIFKSKEQLAELEQLMSDNSTEWWGDRQGQLEHEISLLQRKQEIQSRIYDDKIKELEYEQMLYKEDSAEYANLEQQKLDIIYLKRQQAEDMYNQLRQQGYDSESDIVRQYKDLWHDYNVEIRQMQIDAAQKVRDAEIDALKKQQEAMEKISDAKKKLLEETIAMIKEEEKARNDADKDRINNEIDNMKKLADARKRELQRQKDERAYQKDIDKSNDEISAIERELAKIQFDNSEWAIAERFKLEQQLKEKTEALDDKQYENKIDKEMDAIDEQVKLFEEQKKHELDIIEKNAMTEAEIHKKAVAMMDKENKSLYDKLKKMLVDTGQMGKAEFDSLWNSANTGLEQFGIKTEGTLNSLDAMYEMMKKLADEAERLGNAPLDIGGSTGGSTTNKPNNPNKPSGGLSEKGTQQLNEQKYLHQQMVIAKETNNKALEDWVKRRRKEWGLDPDTGAIVKQFHKGLDYGQVGTGLKPDELVAKLVKKEWVFTDNQFGNLTNNIKGLVSQKQSAMPNVNLVFNGTVTEGAKPMLKEFKKDIEDVFYKLINKTM
ncbi:MAG: hypothetical protein ACRDD7_03540 [Peptostreptococcaceae bacterium]